MGLMDILLIWCPIVGLLIIARLEVRDALAYRRELKKWEAAQKSVQAPHAGQSAHKMRPIAATIQPTVRVSGLTILASWRHRYDVVGESFNNDDGSSRQDFLAAIAESRPPFAEAAVSIEKYDYKGELALAVKVNGCQIGNIARKDICAVSRDLEEADGIDLVVFGGENGKFYGAAVTLFRDNDIDDDFVE